MFNAAAFTIQCRGIRFTLEKKFEVRTFNAAALSSQCRGIRSPTQKNKKPHSRALFIFSYFSLNQNPKNLKTQKSLNTQLFNQPKSSPNPTSTSLNSFYPSTTTLFQRASWVEGSLQSYFSCGFSSNQVSVLVLFYRRDYCLKTFGIGGRKYIECGFEESSYYDKGL